MKRFIAAIVLALGLLAAPAAAQVPEYENLYGNAEGTGYTCYYDQSRPWLANVSGTRYLRADVLVQCDARSTWRYKLQSLRIETRYGQSVDGGVWNPYSQYADVEVDVTGDTAMSVSHQPTQDRCNYGAASRYYRTRTTATIVIWDAGTNLTLTDSFVIRMPTQVKHPCGVLEP